MDRPLSPLVLRTSRPSPAEGGGTNPDLAPFPFSGRGVGERGLRFAGYAAIFDRPDRGGDVVRRGAFARALRSAGEVPLLWQHKGGAVVGRIEHLAEDERGLRVIATLNDGRLARLLETKRVDGLSFGYRVREAKSAGGLRELIALDLIEVSLVARPMQPRARVHAVEQGGG